jgi:hypothetical protein
MKPVLCLALAAAAFAWGDEASDRAAIQNAIKQFNDPQTRASVLAPGADIPDLSGRPWDQRSRLYFTFKDVRFITPDVAMADATASQYGSLMLRNEPVVFILKREGGEWKIDSLRLLWYRGAQIVPVRNPTP